MVRRATDIAHQSTDFRPIELGRDGRRHFVGHDDEGAFEFLDQLDEWIAAGSQVALQPPADVRKVADALTQPDITLAREHGVQFANRPFQGPVCIDALGANQLIRSRNQNGVVEHQQLRGKNGRLGLTDYEKAFCPALPPLPDIFDLRGIDREQGCIVLVRPDQHVAHVLPLDDHAGLSAFLGGILLPCRPPAQEDTPMTATPDSPRTAPQPA